MQATPPNKRKQIQSLVMGGLLPILVFTLIEDQWGILWGLVAGMCFGVGEILWEWVTRKKVEALTWGGNALFIFLGGISLFTQEGPWFKLQPALMEAAMALMLLGSVAIGKPLLLILLQKQAGLSADWEAALPKARSLYLKKAFRGMTLRMGCFFALHTALAVWAALYWPTAAWALLKGLGVTVSLIVYGVVESFILRYRMASIP